MKKKKLLSVTFLLLMMSIILMLPKKDVNASTYTIYVNRQTNIVNVVNSKTKKLVRAMYCSTGKNNGTIKGTFYTNEKLRWHALYGGVYGQYCTRFSGSYLFHSVPYTTTRCSKVETKEYNKLGKQASKGCVRLAVVDCKWIYNHCKLGTKVVINDTKKLKKPSRRLLKISTSRKTGWDPTDPNSSNPYYPTLKLKGKSYLTVKKGTLLFRPLNAIKVSSSFTSSSTLLKYVKVTGKVNTKKTGSYRLTYTLTDPATLLKKTLTLTFKVV